MDERAWDGSAVRAAAANGRRALLLAGTGLSAAVLARPNGTPAANKAKKKCNNEKKQCRQAVRQICGDQGCLDRFLPCCDTCKVGQGIVCVLSQA